MERLMIVVLFIILLTVWIMSVRRKLVEMNENISNAMNQIGVQISSCLHTLVSLLDIAKNYVPDEAGMLISQVRIWQSVITAESLPEEVIRQERLICETVGKIVSIAEQCPELKEDQDYVRYMDAVHCYEGMMRTSSLIYNDSVTKFNRVVRLFPNSLVVWALGFHKRDYMEFAGTERI